MPRLRRSLLLRVALRNVTPCISMLLAPAHTKEERAGITISLPCRPLSLAAKFLTENTDTPLMIVRAGRRSMEMSTVIGVDFCPTKTTATEVLSLHLHELLPLESWVRPEGQAIEVRKAPLVVLDMDGTVTRKDALHGNTVSNNLAKSAAVAAIKQCLNQGVVAVNSGNHALLQVCCEPRHVAPLCLVKR